MRPPAAAAAALAALLAPAARVAAQSCSGVGGAFVLTDLEGTCTYDKLLAAYVDQVYDASGSLSAQCLLNSLNAQLSAENAAPPPSCAPIYVEFGSSGGNTKTVEVPGLTAHHTCPATVDKSNWDREACDDNGNHCSVGDTFAVAVNLVSEVGAGSTVSVTRTDAGGGWGMNVAFTCPCPGSPAQLDFDAKVMNATGAATGAEGGAALCRQLYDGQDVVPFTRAADIGDDLHFEKMFFNGLGDWQEEVETNYESADGSATSNLQTDGAKIDEFYVGEGSYSRVAWPGSLTNFNDGQGGDCPSRAAMCCWPKDRQANDNNGNCATAYDKNCVDKDVADNTNLCFADYEKGDKSSGYGSAQGFAVFPGDDNNGEGAIHCHGLAWADDEYDHTARYKANNLFFVSMYDHMMQRGYVKEIPGMPMCGCMEQMPLATRSDCTQVDLEEDWEVAYDGTSFEMRMIKIEIDFNACQGRNNRNNDLWAYAARLYDEGRMTNKQFGIVGRVLTNDNDCYHGVIKAKHDKGFITGYVPDAATWTKVAGRDAMYLQPMSAARFNRALENSVTPDTPIIHRVCPDCVETHKHIYYRRLTTPPEGVDVLNDILRHSSSSSMYGNRWNEDFTLHSTYDDAVSGTGNWTCGSSGTYFNYRRAFYGECSPSGSTVRNQHSNFNSHPGPRPDVAFFVNKPYAAGAQDFIPGSTGAVGETDESIGSVGIPGNTLEDDGDFLISGAGSDIWGSSDSFHYLSQPWDGDIDVKVHVSDFFAPDSWSKAGLMLRSDNSPDAAAATNVLTGSNGVQMAVRYSKGRDMVMSGSSSRRRLQSDYSYDGSDAVWLRLVKKMDTIEWYTGTDGTGEAWTLQATETVFFPDDHYLVGLAITSHSANTLAEARFSEYEIQAYEFPTGAPSGSPAPTGFTPINEIDTQREGSYFHDRDTGTEIFQGSGTGLVGRSDSFLFHCSERPVDDEEFWAEMYISRFDSYKTNGRGGIMMRDSLEPDALNVFVGAASNRNGVVFQSRTVAGQKTVVHAMEHVNDANKFWVKLNKAGNMLTASYKENKEDAWIVLGSQELAFTSDLLYVGRAVTGGTQGNDLETLETERYAVLPDEGLPSAAPTVSSMPTWVEQNLIRGSTNVLEGVVASQSCDYPTTQASNAIDGQHANGYYPNIAHTCYSYSPWWKVDLGRDALISSVTVYNRLGCCQDRFGGTDLEILDDAGDVVASQPFVGAVDAYDFTFNEVVGRAVKINRSQGRWGYLNFAEVEVYGKPASGDAVTESPFLWEGAGFCADQNGGGYATLTFADEADLNACKERCVATVAATANILRLVGLERKGETDECACRYDGALDCDTYNGGCWNPSSPGTGPVAGTRVGPGWVCYKNVNYVPGASAAPTASDAPTLEVTEV